MSFEHAFLEGACCPAYRVFNTPISCETYDAVSRRSYAGRALLPCLERTAQECHGAFINAAPCLERTAQECHGAFINAAPCLERTAKKCYDAFIFSVSRTKRTERAHCLRLAIFMSIGPLHSPPVLAKDRS